MVCLQLATCSGATRAKDIKAALSAATPESTASVWEDHPWIESIWAANWGLCRGGASDSDLRFALFDAAVAKASRTALAAVDSQYWFWPQPPTFGGLNSV